MSTHPAFVERFKAFQLAAARRGWNIWVSYSERTYEQQALLWAKSPTNPNSTNPTGNPASNPDAVIGKTIWGWTAIGSWHQKQADGYSYAYDLSWTGCTAAQMHELAEPYGIRFPYMPAEPWHCQPWDIHGFYPAPAMTEDDMTPAQFATAIGAIHDPAAEQRGEPCILIPLINDTLDGFNDFPLAAALSYTHTEMKRARIAG